MHHQQRWNHLSPWTKVLLEINHSATQEIQSQYSDWIMGGLDPSRGKRMSPFNMLRVVLAHTNEHKNLMCFTPTTAKMQKFQQDGCERMVQQR
jgi:hypothetical protein